MRAMYRHGQKLKLHPKVVIIDQIRKFAAERQAAEGDFIGPRTKDVPPVSTSTAVMRGH